MTYLAITALFCPEGLPEAEAGVFDAPRATRWMAFIEDIMPARVL